MDSEYVIFVIDTSNSMQRGAWPLVQKKLQETLEVYPQVKGLQVMNDDGIYMFSQYAGKWIPDTAGRRRVILSTLASWQPFSNSSPGGGHRRGDPQLLFRRQESQHLLFRGRVQRDRHPAGDRRGGPHQPGIGGRRSTHADSRGRFPDGHRKDAAAGQHGGALCIPDARLVLPQRRGVRGPERHAALNGIGAAGHTDPRPLPRPYCFSSIPTSVTSSAGGAAAEIEPGGPNRSDHRLKRLSALWSFSRACSRWLPNISASGSMYSFSPSV
ncbi:MAG: hypothetical protein MZU91_00625 [Desulfosudis oleivorans]|nr:hypothetical protein [Desulfosudis oleivorans]